VQCLASKPLPLQPSIKVFTKVPFLHCPSPQRYLDAF
jgi:hypothetical protein